MNSFYEELTKSELNILELVAKGLTNQEIADELFVSKRTVATHMTHIYEKSGILKENTGDTSVMRLRLALLYINSEERCSECKYKKVYENAMRLFKEG